MSPGPDTQDTEELKPCPFCGGEAAVGTIRYTQSPYCDERCKDQLDYWSINCIRCCAKTSGLSGYPSEADAIAAWNTRPDSPVTVMREMQSNLTDEDLDAWSEQAKRDDWHQRFVGSDIRQLIGEIQRTREALARISR